MRPASLQVVSSPTNAPLVSSTPPPAIATAKPETSQSVEVAFTSLRVWYTTGNANIRDCPSTTCGVVGTLSAVESVSLDASAEGQAVNPGNAQWYRVQGGGYIYSGVVTSSAPSVQQPAQPALVGQPTQPAAPVQQRPGNCSTGVAIGLTDRQAAQWSHLDRDGEGVACYNDQGIIADRPTCLAYRPVIFAHNALASLSPVDAYTACTLLNPPI